MAKPNPFGVWLDSLTDEQLKAAAKQRSEDAKKLQREAASAQKMADLCRKELRRRKRTAKASG